MSFSLPALGTVYHPQQGLGVIKSAFAPNNELTCLRCPHYAFQLMTGLIEVLGDQHWQDVTLECCDGHSVRSSKIFLAACSPYFRQVLTQQDSKVYLSGITLEVLEILLVFMSQGNIDVSPRLLLDVIDAATSLQIQGFQTALSQYLKQNNKHLDSQYEVDKEVLKEDAGSESFNNEQAFPSFSHGATTLPKVPLSTSTIISAEPARATDAISAPPDSLIEISPLITSTLENLLQPTSNHVHDISFETEKSKKGVGWPKIIQRLGRPRKTEFTVESQKHKSGSGSPKTLFIETKKSKKYRECYVKLEELKKNRGSLKKSEEHTHPSNFTRPSDSQVSSLTSPPTVTEPELTSHIETHVTSSFTPSPISTLPLTMAELEPTTPLAGDELTSQSACVSSGILPKSQPPVENKPSQITDSCKFATHITRRSLTKQVEASTGDLIRIGCESRKSKRVDNLLMSNAVSDVTQVLKRGICRPDESDKPKKCNGRLSGEKPFQCIPCNKNFSRRGNLIRHQRTHWR